MGFVLVFRILVFLGAALVSIRLEVPVEETLATALFILMDLVIVNLLLVFLNLFLAVHGLQSLTSHFHVRNQSIASTTTEVLPYDDPE